MERQTCRSSINQYYKRMNKLEVYSFSEYIPVRTLAHSIKDGNSESIMRAAVYMAHFVSLIADEKSVLIPMPGRKGTADYTMRLAERISELTGVAYADILRSKPHMPQYYRKLRYGVRGMSLLSFFLNADLPCGCRPILIDNVLDTGTTAMSALRALGVPADLVVIGNTENYRLYDYPIHVLERSLTLQ